MMGEILSWWQHLSVSEAALVVIEALIVVLLSVHIADFWRKS